ncbi:putative periplasmic protein [Trypanosoma grayi]|uniref:putative periplasmic protein n=1 Tax=Trypanosoma grayi TaxID=71804 RepID=UPI0004F43CF7|nr:putative periplasmic protein [Trypanosoma grayi]KEG09187.1 putative periplasmic protein [Trypanosoma grayi]
MRDAAELSIVCLGTGKGASMVYDGGCSPGYVLCSDGRPLVLFGAGYGVTRQCLRYFGAIPESIFVFSNRSHMSAELPVIIAVESHKGRRLHIVASVDVVHRLREHRLAEVRSRIDFSAPDENSVCKFVALRDTTCPPAAHPSPYYLPGTSEISLVAFDTPATEASCGVVVLHHGVPMVVLTGDCAYNAERHQKILRMAPVVILDARKKSSLDHAGFADIISAVENCGGVPSRVFIGQYGQPWEAPPVLRDIAVAPIVEGAVVVLGEHPSLADAEDALRSISYRSHRSNAEVPSECRPTKVFVINNDSPDLPPALVMAQHFRTMAQVKQRISELLHMRPVGDLFCAETGQKLRDITQFTHGMRVVATRRGGRPFDTPAPSVDEKQHRALVDHKPMGNTSSSVGFDDYMQRASRALGRTMGYEGATNSTAVVAEPSRDVPDTFIDSLSANGADVSPNTTSSAEQPEEQTQRGDSNTSTGGLCLRFTTLRT